MALALAGSGAKLTTTWGAADSVPARGRGEAEMEQAALQERAGPDSNWQSGVGSSSASDSDVSAAGMLARLPSKGSSWPLTIGAGVDLGLHRALDGLRLLRLVQAACGRCQRDVKLDGRAASAGRG